VLWPVVFSYCFVRLIEIWTAKQSRPARQDTTPPFPAATLQSASALLGRHRD